MIDVEFEVDFGVGRVRTSRRGRGNGEAAGGGGMIPAGFSGDSDESRYVDSSSSSRDLPCGVEGGLIRSTFDF